MSCSEWHVLPCAMIFIFLFQGPHNRLPSPQSLLTKSHKEQQAHTHSGKSLTADFLVPRVLCMYIITVKGFLMLLLWSLRIRVLVFLYVLDA